MNDMALVIKDIDRVADNSDWVDRPSDWIMNRDTGSVASSKRAPAFVDKRVSADVLISMRMTYAAHLLNEVIEINAKKASGTPVLRGTRFKIAQILAELADDKSVSKLAREFDLDREKIEEMLHGMAILLDRPFLK